MIWHPVELKLENLDDRSAGYNITCVKKIPYWYLISWDFGDTVRVFRGVLFLRLKQVNMKKGHLILQFKDSQLLFLFLQSLNL